MTLLNLSLFEDKHYILGLSGGCDSTALFHLLLHHKINFEVVHFNHNLRPNALKDEKFCQQLCQQNNIKLQTISLQINTTKNTENNARQQRLNFYQQNYPNQTILLAHHQNDCYENFFIRLLRGSNISGLTALRSKININAVTYLRPLLHQSKQQLLNYLQTQKLSWREDETNQQNIYLRNIIRNTILPKLGDIKGFGPINLSLKFCQQDAQFLEEIALEKWQNLDNHIESYQQLHPALFARIMRLIYQEVMQDNQISHTLIQRAYEEIHQSHKQTIQVTLKKNFIMTINQNRQISFNKKNDYPTTLWQWQTNKAIKIANHQFSLDQNTTYEQFNCQQLTNHLTIRFWQQGDRIIPFGKKTAKKVKDIFINAKIPLEQRWQIPLLLHQNTIIWIPHLARAHFALTSKHSKNIFISYNKI